MSRVESFNFEAFLTQWEENASLLNEALATCADVSVSSYKNHVDQSDQIKAIVESLKTSTTVEGIDACISNETYKQRAIALLHNMLPWIHYFSSFSSKVTWYFAHLQDGSRMIDNMVECETLRETLMTVLDEEPFDGNLCLMWLLNTPEDLVAATMKVAWTSLPQLWLLIADPAYSGHVQSVITKFDLLAWRNDEGDSPLHSWVRVAHGTLPELQSTLKAMYNLNPEIVLDKNNNGENLLHAATAFVVSHLSQSPRFLCDMFLRCIEAKDNNGNTLLHRLVLQLGQKNESGAYEYKCYVGDVLNAIVMLVKQAGADVCLQNNNESKTPFALLIDLLGVFDLHNQRVHVDSLSPLETDGLCACFVRMGSECRQTLMAHGDGQALILMLVSFLDQPQITSFIAEIDQQNYRFNKEDETAARVVDRFVDEELHRLSRGNYGFLAIDKKKIAVARLSVYAKAGMLSDEQLMRVMATEVSYTQFQVLPIIALLSKWSEQARVFQRYAHIFCTTAFLDRLKLSYSKRQLKIFLLQAFIDRTKDIMLALDMDVAEFSSLMSVKMNDLPRSKYVFFHKWLVFASIETVYDTLCHVLFKNIGAIERLFCDAELWHGLGVKVRNDAWFYETPKLGCDFGEKWPDNCRLGALERFEREPFYGLTLASCVRACTGSDSLADSLADFRSKVDMVFVKSPKDRFKGQISKKGLALWLRIYVKWRIGAKPGHFENAELVKRKLVIAGKIAKALVEDRVLSLNDQEIRDINNGRTLKALYGAVQNLLSHEVGVSEEKAGECAVSANHVTVDDLDAIDGLDAAPTMPGIQMREFNTQRLLTPGPHSAACGAAADASDSARSAAVVTDKTSASPR